MNLKYLGVRIFKEMKHFIALYHTKKLKEKTEKLEINLTRNWPICWTWD